MSPPAVRTADQIAARAQLEAWALFVFAGVAAYFATANMADFTRVSIPFLGFDGSGRTSSTGHFGFAVQGLLFATVVYAAHRISRQRPGRLSLAALPMILGLTWGYWAMHVSDAVARLISDPSVWGFPSESTLAVIAGLSTLANSLPASIAMGIATRSARTWWRALGVSLIASVLMYLMVARGMMAGGVSDPTMPAFIVWHLGMAAVLARWAFCAAMESTARDPRLCPACGYTLAGLPTRVCPECGYDDSDPAIGPAKAALRTSMRNTLAAIAPDQLAAHSASARQALAASDIWLAAHHILAFAPMPREPDLMPLLHQAIAASKVIAFPAVDWNSGAMTPALATDLDAHLITGRHGVREPAPDRPRLDPGSLHLVLVPGLAFDVTGNRLGRGKGFYDRFLGSLPPSTITIGVCFNCQIVPHVPNVPTDRRVTHLLTESGLRPAFTTPLPG